MSEKEQEIQLLSHRDSMNADAIATFSDKLSQVMQEIELMKKKQGQIGSVAEFFNQNIFCSVASRAHETKRKRRPVH